MFEARCPQVFESAATAKVYENYETNGEFFSGTLATDTEPFCGRSSLKNPSSVYKKRHDEFGISLTSFGKVKDICFLKLH